MRPQDRIGNQSTTVLLGGETQMSYWIFKISEHSTYPDVPGKAYVFDNTHSVRVRRDDEFLYLQKACNKYGLTGAGRIAKVSCRKARVEERHSPRVREVFVAHLADVIWFSQPFDLSSQSKAGLANRRLAKLPNDLNSIGWSLSMPRIDGDLFVRLLDAALGSTDTVLDDGSTDGSWYVDDAWSLVRKRCRLSAFRLAVLARHKYTCAVCGTRRRSVLDAAHIRGYAKDASNRANPANGICLCRFCHAALDAGDIILYPDGRLRIATNSDDDVSRLHFTALSEAVRRDCLKGVDSRFLEELADGAAATQGAVERSPDASEYCN